MRIPKNLEAEILARADNVGPSFTVNTRDCEPMQPGTIEALARVAKHVVDHVGTWTFRIPNWMPTPLNKIMYARHWTVGSKRKKADAEIVAHYGRGVPKAVDSKRGVSMHVCFPKGKRMPDVDALWKSLLDSLVKCGILVNDSAAWASMNPVEYSRGESLVTFITVEDLA